MHGRIPGFWHPWVIPVIPGRLTLSSRQTPGALLVGVWCLLQYLRHNKADWQFFYWISAERVFFGMHSDPSFRDLKLLVVNGVQ